MNIEHIDLRGLGEPSPKFSRDICATQLGFVDGPPRPYANPLGPSLTHKTTPWFSPTKLSFLPR